MHKFWSTAAAALLVVPAAWTPALAQASGQQQNAKPARDPNEIVCERQNETGSRLAITKVCKTRAQWAEDQRADRVILEKVQSTRELSVGR